MTQQQALNRALIVRNRMVKKYTPLIHAALQWQIQEAIKVILEKGLHGAQGNIHVGIINRKVYDVLHDMYMEAANLAAKNGKVKRKGFPFNFSWSFVDAIKTFVGKYLLDEVVLPISQTTINQVEAAINKGLENGWHVTKVAAELENSELTKYRARLIARTEQTRAINFAQIVKADDENFEVEKTWFAVEDLRTRLSHTHFGVDGQKRDLYERFSNGLLFPGDPEGSGREVCNCRCTLLYNMKRDENNQLIPKVKPGIHILSYMTDRQIFG